MNDLFRTVSSIKSDCMETWQNRIFLTFDIDSLHDAILGDTIDLA